MRRVPMRTAVMWQCSRIAARVIFDNVAMLLRAYATPSYSSLLFLQTTCRSSGAEPCRRALRFNLCERPPQKRCLQSSGRSLQQVSSGV